MAESAKKDQLRRQPASERRRSSVWASYTPGSSQEDSKPKPVVAFYVYLTNWAGGRLAIKYVRGRPFPMEKVTLGGTYLYFPNGLVYVRESTGEINAKIHARLHQMQSAWT